MVQGQAAETLVMARTHRTGPEGQTWRQPDGSVRSPLESWTQELHAELSSVTAVQSTELLLSLDTAQSVHQGSHECFGHSIAWGAPVHSLSGSLRPAQSPPRSFSLHPLFPEVWLSHQL